MKRVNAIITPGSITVNYDGQTHQILRTEAVAPKILAALKAKRYDEIPDLVSASKRLERASSGMFSIKDGQVMVDGVPAPLVLGRKIEEFANEGLPYEPLVSFAKNLQANPSFRAVNELYQFLEKNNHPITDNGNFIAYKRVRGDFKDIHSNTMDNSVGRTVEMPRNQVNENPNETCSYGLHVANWHYAHKQYGGAAGEVMLEVEVNPADVVAVPVDYNQSKMRVCKYKVLGVVEEELSSGPLRITNPAPAPTPVSYDEEEEEEESKCCLNCYVQLDADYGDGDELCADCSDEEEEESSSEEESESEEDDLEEEDDVYPWDDELDE